MVLDEPNASLDGDGETALVRALFTAKSWGATVVIVAHQPRILAPVDQLLLLRRGALEAFGPRDEVLEPPAPATAVGGAGASLLPTQVGAGPTVQ